MRAIEFQSPSLRGSGRFEAARADIQRKLDKVSIPFIAGQWSLRGAPKSAQKPRWRFQSPSLRGSGRFVHGGPRKGRRLRCFNPLHCGAVVASRCACRSPGTVGSGFNPLHCGAVVASPERGQRLENQLECFNPLHCGAVVASFDRPTRRKAGGQGFNPLHCGAVVASPSSNWQQVGTEGFNPLHCGAVVASYEPKGSPEV